MSETKPRRKRAKRVRLQEPTPGKRKDGIRTVADLLARCVRDDETRCMVWTGSARKGIASVWLPGVGPRSLTNAITVLAHGVAHRGEKRWVAKCGNALCAEPSHRHWVTPSRQQQQLRPTIDPEHRMRITIGTRKAKGKVTDEIAAEIRASDEPTGVLADRFNLHPSYVWGIRTQRMRRATVANSSVFTFTGTGS